MGAYLELKGMPGKTVAEAIETAVFVAQKLGCPVMLQLNDRVMLLTPDSIPAQVHRDNFGKPQ